MPIEHTTIEMTPQQRAEASRQAQMVNRRLNPNSTEAPNELGKESFLRLLVTELRHQDPTRPMEDREFIAQMAQFSSLEQMRNMNQEMRNLIRSSQSSEAYNLLGRHIEAFNPANNTRVTGIVSSVRIQNDQFTLMVGDTEVTLDQVQRVTRPAPNGAQGGVLLQPANH